MANFAYLRNRRRKRADPLDAARRRLQEELRGLTKLGEGLPTDAWSARVMGWEGNQARVYWAEVGAAVPPAWAFSGRSRRPAADAYNAQTNYFYGMLYALTERALFGAGLDPHLDILHADEYDRPTLAYDLIEPFRPWVDRFILHQILREDLLPDEVIIPKDEGFWLSRAAKKNSFLLSTAGCAKPCAGMADR